MQLTLMEFAQTGAPLKASTVLMPNVLRNVDFPAILEPVIISIFSSLFKEKSFKTLVRTGISGWPIEAAVKV
jgi:hypothetical protein